ncbi:MAG TPA: nicotinate-nicotinamide nucleotide adenylyltransferase [Bryobacteraceae bacterium]|nr:nicotinate-nicotinamide nucleotide adenylyltransferase [Bryobacteraceae bacterium]
MEFYHRSSGRPQTIGILAGSFNPPTVAHVELAQAAQGVVDEVLWVVPREFPHKEYFGATLEQRLEMLEAVRIPAPHSIAATEKGLFIEIARDCRRYYDPGARLYFICGRDAAERILHWDYGRPGVVEEMLGEFELLVAPRGGVYEPPEAYRHRIHPLVADGGIEAVSSTEVRERIARGEAWERLVPDTIIDRVREIYS